MASWGRNEEGAAYRGAMGVLERDCLLLTPRRAPWATQAGICMKICKTILSFPEDRVQMGGGQPAVRGGSPGPGYRHVLEPLGVHFWLCHDQRAIWDKYLSFPKSQFPNLSSGGHNTYKPCR